MTSKYDPKVFVYTTVLATYIKKSMKYQTYIYVTAFTALVSQYV